jgi:DNA ligase D-like protein (predicted ligase)
MLATLVAQPFSQKGWLFEPKFDGERCLALRCGADIQLLSRNRKRLNDRYPELVAAFGAQRAERFSQVGHPSEQLRRKIPVWIYLFDLVHLEGNDTRQLPLHKRKELLREALDFRNPIRFTASRETEGQAYFEDACRKGWEGIIGKNHASVYVSKRSREWLKFKCLKEQEFVIGGYTDPKGRRIGFGALLVGYYKAGKLVYAGKVGTGFDEETLRRLGRQLAQLQTKTSPFAASDPPSRGAHWVKPKLVGQIAFTEWTLEGRLRHPRYLGLRFDKRPSAVVQEQ